MAGRTWDVARRERLGRASLLAMVFVMCLVLVGCGSASSQDTVTNTDASQTTAAGSEQAELDLSAMQGFNAGMPTGSLKMPEEPEAPKELTESETEETDRAVRAYTPSQEESLLINNAKHFYYYEQLTSDQRTLYDMLLELLHDPTNEDAVLAIKFDKNVDEKQFVKDLQMAVLATQYDHPEFFWLYNGLETDISLAKPKSRSNEYYLTLAKPYKRYKQEMTAFNNAVKDFLSDIDLSGSDYQIARQIHDKLISMVTYDQEVAQSEYNDLAHTAYGALVENSSGKAHYAVCDGYSQAYVYLLQQAGIDATVILGAAGETAADAGPHAWTIVKLDGDWYEIDITWDDSSESWKAALAEAKKQDPNNKAIPRFEEALGSGEFCDALDHFLCNVTTAVISDYTPTNLTKYVFSDGAELQLIKKSVHMRANELKGFDGYDALMDLAPVARGTKYAYAG